MVSLWETKQMPHYEIKRIINAPVSKIWPILTDAKTLADGSFSIIKIEGEIAEGQTIKLWSEADPKRSFAIHVRDVIENKSMRWENGLPLGLFLGARKFVLTEVGGGTEFHMREDYTGPLAKLMYRVIPDLNPTFVKFADGLQAVAET